MPLVAVTQNGLPARTACSTHRHPAASIKILNIRSLATSDVGEGPLAEVCLNHLQSAQALTIPQEIHRPRALKLHTGMTNNVRTLVPYAPLMQLARKSEKNYNAIN